MNAAIKIAQWVEKKPIILIRFDQRTSEGLYRSLRGFEHLTIVKPHADFDFFKMPTICLVEVIFARKTSCYLGTAFHKMAISTLDSRLTIKKLRELRLDSLKSLTKLIKKSWKKSEIDSNIPSKGDIASFTPKLSAHVIKILAADPENHFALETAFSQLPGLKEVTNNHWAQKNAIQTAIAAFGIKGSPIAHQRSLKPGTSSSLEQYLYEDNVVHADASELPGYELISKDVTGRAVFKDGDERLIVYTANKLPLERMLGVDLIYINETRGNIVMIQYKMLEEKEQNDGKRDWLFRPDEQFYDEISRMRLLDFVDSLDDYRLNRNPFFFKFVKRKIEKNSHQSFLVSLDHLKQILSSPKNKGPRGGIRVSYETLDGTYLREADMISLIRSGYIGTHKAETRELAAIIQKVAQGERALVLAWQQKIQEMEQ